MKTNAIAETSPRHHLPVGAFQSLFIKLSSYFGAQAVVQLANILTGFLLIRALDKSQYGWFTIVTGAMAMISVLADSGLGSAFTAIGGKTFSDPGSFAGLAGFVRRRRLRFLTVASLFVLPINGWALYQNGASFFTLITLLVLVVVAAIPSTDAVVLMTINKLFSRVQSILAADLVLSLSKLVMVLAVCWLGPSAIAATFCVLSSHWLYVGLLRFQTSDVLAVSPGPIDEHVPQINRTIVHVLPTCIFTCIQAQLATYILSFFASVEQVADLGALMRLAVAFTFLSIPLHQIVLPRLARCQSRRQLRNDIIGTICGSGVVAILVVLGAYLFSPMLLMLLGDKYVHLDKELLTFMAMTAVGFLSNAAWGIAFTRAWVTNAWANIPLVICLQLAAAPYIDFSQVGGVIMFGVISNLASFSVALWLVAAGHRQESFEHE